MRVGGGVFVSYHPTPRFRCKNSWQRPSPVPSDPRVCSVEGVHGEEPAPVGLHVRTARAKLQPVQEGTFI